MIGRLLCRLGRHTTSSKYMAGPWFRYGFCTRCGADLH